jgi:hypothetical protein
MSTRIVEIDMGHAGDGEAGADLSYDAERRRQELLDNAVESRPGYRV